MLNRILVPLDGSETAEKVLTHLGPMLERTDSRVVLAMAVWPGSMAIAPMTPLNDLLNHAEEQARLYLEPLAESMRADGVEVEVDVHIGMPVDMILRLAREKEVAMIAMTTHGRSGAARWLMGSVAERVLRSATVPVMVVRSFEADADGKPAPAEAERWVPERILVPLDGSERSRLTAPLVAGLADLFGAKVDLLRVVVSPSDYGENSRAESALARDQQAFARAGVEAVTHLRHASSATEAILDFARRAKVGLIVMRSHGRDGIPRWMLGSVAEEVARRATVPLLIARRTPKELTEWELAEAFATGVEPMA